MSSMLSDVVSSGTAARARAAGFKLPAGGKTGTTDDYSDAWFIGYTPHLLTGVWFGLDQPGADHARGFGGVVAVPAWASFMRAATRGASPDWYRMPLDVENVSICRISGKRSGSGCRDAHLAPASASSGLLQDPSQLPAMEVRDAGQSPPQLLPPDEPIVYEDLFPVGNIPLEICPLHNGMQLAGTPLVDAVVRADDRLEPAAPGAAIRGAATRLFVDRVPAADGSYRIVVRQRQ